MLKTKVVVIDGIRQISVREMIVPAVGPEEVLVKIHQCTICTTEWQTWAGRRKSQGRKLPWAPGHEMSGEIIELGEDVPPQLQKGQRVGFAPQSSIGCSECYFCRKGYYNRCIKKYKEKEVDGVFGSFAMAQYFVCSAKRIYTFNDNMPYVDIGFLEPTATVVHGIKKLRVVPGENVLVIGAGNLGVINAQVARHFGGRVLVSEINSDRCQLAEAMGFVTVDPTKTSLDEKISEFTGGIGMDAIILAVGTTEANRQAMKYLASMGRVLLFSAGYPKPEMDIDPNDIHYKEQEIIGTYGGVTTDYFLAAQLLDRGLVKVSDLVSHQVPIDDAEKAFELAAKPGNYRVSIIMW